MKRKIFYLIMIMLVLIVSCGKKNKSANGEGNRKEIVLRFSWWGGDTRHKATLEAIKLFEEKNPGIKIKAEYSGWDSYFEKLSTQITGNTAPDIMQIDWNWLYIFSKTGDGFYDFNKLKDEFNIGNYDEQALSYTTINGKVTAIPVGMNGTSFYYNKTLYDKAGLPIPKTVDDLFNAAKVMKEKLGSGNYPINLVTSDSGYLFILKYYLEQKYGKSLINSDNKIGVTKEELIDGLKFCKSLVDAGVTNSSKDISGSGNTLTEQDPLWINGKIGGTQAWSTVIVIMEDTLTKGNELVTGAELRGIGDNKSAFIKVNMTFAISKNTKHPKEAAKFLNFLLSDPEAAKILGNTRGIPLNKSAYAELEKLGLINGLPAEGLEKAIQFAGPKSSPYTEDERVRKLVLKYTQKVDYGEIAPEQAGNELYAELEKILVQMTR